MPDTCLMKNIALTLENLNKTAPISLTYVLDASGRPTFPLDSYGEISIDISGVFSGGAGPQGVDVSGSGCGTYQVLDMLVYQVQLMKSCIKKHEIVLEAKLATQLQSPDACELAFELLTCALDGELDASANPCNKYFNVSQVPASGYPFGDTEINYVNLARCLETRDVGYPLDISSTTVTLSRSAELQGDTSDPFEDPRPKLGLTAVDKPAIMLSTHAQAGIEGANISEDGIFQLITNITLLLMVINKGLNPSVINLDWGGQTTAFEGGTLPVSLFA
jgi:hypothetical protein